MAALTWIWVHRTHSSHPGLGMGGRYVSAEVAAEMIRDGCAQDVQTDPRRLKFPSTADPFVPPRAARAFEDDEDDEPPPLEDKPPPKRSRGRPRKGTYKTTRLKPDG